MQKQIIFTFFSFLLSMFEHIYSDLVVPALEVTQRYSRLNFYSFSSAIQVPITFLITACPNLNKTICTRIC